MARDIYQVMKEMVHSKITTTQIYADFQISRLEIDFPSIVYAPNQPIFGKMDTNMMDTLLFDGFFVCGIILMIF